MITLITKHYGIALCFVLMLLSSCSSSHSAFHPKRSRLQFAKTEPVNHIVRANVEIEHNYETKAADLIRKSDRMQNVDEKHVFVPMQVSNPIHRNARDLNDYTSVGVAINIPALVPVTSLIRAANDPVEEEKDRSIWSVLSLVSGVLSWLFIFFPVTNILGIAFGIMGFRYARMNKGVGVKMALWGIVLSVLNLLVVGAGIVLLLIIL